MVAIVDYNVGNLASVKNALNKIGTNIKIVSNPDELINFDKVILPGVGAFGDAMENLRQTNMKDAVINFANSGKPIMGICLGMQLLFDKSYEFGDHKGLGLISGQIVPFDKDKMDMEDHKVPHVGWNKIFTKKNKIFDNLNNPYLYFVHSFHPITDEKYIIAKTHYGYDFASVVQNNNIYGFQPHPEKSHDSGIQILKNFINI
jgi:glutamine amidotransferase